MAKKDSAAVAIVERPLLVRALRVEIGKPVGLTWDQLGTILRAQRSVSHLLAQAAADSYISCSVVGAKATKAAIAPDTKGGSPDTLAYQAILRELERLRTVAASEWAWSGEKLEALNMAAVNLSAIGRSVGKQLRAWNRQRSKRNRPTYWKQQPILLHGESWSLHGDERNGYELRLKILSKGSLRVCLRNAWGAHRDVLTGLVARTIGGGDCKLVYDARARRKNGKRGKWYALLAYAREAPPLPATCDAQAVMVVHRGQRNALTYATSTGRWGVVERGNKITAQKRQFAARRRQLQSVSQAARGNGAKGHGRKRRYQSVDVLNDKEARAVQTFCQQMGARISQLARCHGTGRVGIGAYGGIHPDETDDAARFLDKFPLSRLKSAVVWACRRDGFDVCEIDESYVSSICPRCGNADTRQHNVRTGVFHCSKCSYDRPADYVAVLHMLRRSGADMTVWNSKFAAELRLAERAKAREDTDDDT